MSYAAHRLLPAPEVRIYRRGYDKSVDMWSLGVILFVVLSGYHPFDPEGCAPEDDLQRAIKKGDYDFDDPVWEGVSDGARDLIRKLIQVNPKKRLTAAEVMKHPWVKKFAPRLHKRDRASHVSSMSQSKVRCHLTVIALCKHSSHVRLRACTVVCVLVVVSGGDQRCVQSRRAVTSAATAAAAVRAEPAALLQHAQLVSATNLVAPT